MHITTHRNRNFAAEERIALAPTIGNFVIFVSTVGVLDLGHCFQDLQEPILFFTLA
jgi:hypothetical protein